MADSFHSPSVVLFLCTGNYYRSRFAELLFNHLADQLQLPWQGASRGLALERGIHNVGPIAEATLQRLQSLNIRSSNPRFPLSVTVDCLQQAKLVVALKEEEHRPLLQERFPGWEDRVTYWHVHDTDRAPPEEALPRITELVTELVDSLQTRGNDPDNY